MDNFSLGGIAALVDTKTGRLSESLQVSPTGRPKPMPHHPDTGAAIDGAVIPEWPDVVNRVLSLAAEHSYLPYVGWDVVVTDDGIRMLEGNANTGMHLLQVHGPLLADSRIRRFYEQRGLIH